MARWDMDTKTYRDTAMMLSTQKAAGNLKMTLAEIAAFLTAANVPTRRGGKWGAEQIRSICERAKMHGLPQLSATAA
jgi:hypothetical protein